MSATDFTATMAEIPSHGARLGAAAKMGLEGCVLTGVENEGAFTSTYAIVCLMARKDSEGLEAVVRKHRSWVIQARAVQCLSKIDQAKTAKLLMDPDIPIQMRSVILKSLRVGNDDVLNCVLSNKSWGGLKAAIELMRRFPRGDVYEELMKKWLPKLGSMNQLLGIEIEKKYDEEYLYQSAAAKYPQLMLTMLKNEKGDINFRWYRASKVLSKEHPDEMVSILKEKSWNPRAIWFIARPLIKHSPDAVINIFKERKIIDDGLFWCLRTVFDNTNHRREILNIVLDNIKFVPAETGDRIINLLTGKSKRMYSLDNELTELTIAKRNADWIRLLSDLSDSTPYKFTTEIFIRCLRKHVMAKRETSIGKLLRKLNITETESNSIWTNIYEDDDTTEKLSEMIRKKGLNEDGLSSDFFKSIPKTVTDEVLLSYSTTEEFLEMEIKNRCNLLSQLPYKIAAKTFKVISNDATPENRVIGLKAIWSGVTKQKDVDIEEIREVLTYIYDRIKRDHEEITSPVIKKILLSTPHEILSQLVDGDKLLNLFTVSVGLALPLEDGWTEWCAAVCVRAPVVFEGNDVEIEYNSFFRLILKRINTEFRTLGSTWPKSLITALKDYRTKSKKGDFQPHDADQLATVVKEIVDACDSAGMFGEYTKRTKTEEGNTRIPSTLSDAGYTSDAMTKSEILECWNHVQTLKILRFYGADLLMISPHAKQHATTFLKKLVFKKTSPVAAALVLNIAELPEKRLLAWPQFAVFVKKALTSLLDVSQESSVGYRSVDGRLLVSSIINKLIKDLPMASRTHSMVLFKNNVSSELASEISKWAMPYESLWELSCDILSGCCVSWKDGIPSSFIKDNHSKEGGRVMLNEHDRSLLGNIYRKICPSTRTLRETISWRSDNVRGLTAGAIAASANSQDIVSLLRQFSRPKSAAEEYALNEVVNVFCRSEVTQRDTQSLVHTLRNLFGVDETFECRSVGRAKRNRFTRTPASKARIVRKSEKRSKTLPKQKCYGIDAMLALMDKIEIVNKNEIHGMVSAIVIVFSKIHNCNTRIKASNIHQDYFVLMKRCIALCKKYDKGEAQWYTCYHHFGYVSHILPEAYNIIINRFRLVRNIDGILPLLLPSVTKQARITQLITTGIPEVNKFNDDVKKCFSPSNCFWHSHEIQKHVLSFRQDLFEDLLPPPGTPIPGGGQYLMGIASKQATDRFPGMTYSTGPTFTLKPACQIALYNMHLKQVLTTSSRNRFSLCDQNNWNTELNVLCSLTDVPELSDFENKDHPLRKFLQTVTDAKTKWGDKELPTECSISSVDKSLPDYKESCCMLEGMLKSKELIVALRIFHDQEMALSLVKDHLDIGLIEKTAIPSTSSLLRTINPTKAAEVLTTILGREETRVAARLQLSRSIVACLLYRENDAERLIRQEARLDVSRTADKGVMVSMTSSLATSPLLEKIPSLWDIMLYLKQDPSEETRYVAGELLKTLAGENNVKSLNSEYWPYCASPGLAGICSNFLGKGSLNMHAVICLENWLQFVMSDTTHKVADVDALEVVTAMQRTTNSDLMSRVSLALTQRGHPEAIVRVVGDKINQLKAASEARDLTTARGVLDTLSGLAVTKRRHLVACEYGAKKAAQNLLSNKSTRHFGFRMLAGMMDFKDPAVGSGELFAAFFRAGWDSLTSMMSAVKEAYTDQNGPRNHLQKRAVKYLQDHEQNTDINARLMKMMLINSVSERTNDIERHLFDMMQDDNEYIATMAIDMFPRPEAPAFVAVPKRVVM